MTEALAAAVQARVVSRDGTGAYRFAHDLFREYAYDQLPAAERASLHQRIGQALEASRAVGGEVRWPSWPGTSCSRTRFRRQAWEYSVAAASEATARLAYENAVRHWEHAVAAAVRQASRPYRGAARAGGGAPSAGWPGPGRGPGLPARR